MLRLQVKSIRTITLTAALALGCLRGSLAAGAAGNWTFESAPQPHLGATRDCPPRIDLDTALAQASRLMQQSRYQDAATLLQPLSANNCDARANLLYAAIFEAGGDNLKATVELQRAHARWPSNNSLAASLAREYLSAGQTEKAVAALNHFHATPSTQVQEMQMAVVVYMAANKLPAALAVAQIAYKVYPTLDTLLLLANILQLEGRYPDVNRILGDKRDAYRDSPKFLITLAESEYDAAIYTSARADIERAILLDDSAFQAHYILANILAKLGDLERAIAEYKVAIRLNPSEARTYYQLGLVYGRQMDIVDEEGVLRQALIADDHYAPAHFELGKLLLDQNRLDEAVNHLNMAVECNPRAEEAYYLLVRAYTKLGEKDKAKAMVERLIEVKKENRPSAMNKPPSVAAPQLATDP